MNIGPTINALNAARVRMNVSAHNVANMSTKDYKAREVVQTASPDGPQVVVKETDRPTELVTEIVEQKMASYDYKANLKVFKAQDEMLGHAIDMLA
ncbi:hypothetical protein BVY04_05440 [bacterium M21]|nr:hypothetical protein BVY04_05440 [bacterium M21]